MINMVKDKFMEARTWALRMKKKKERQEFQLPYRPIKATKFKISLV